MNNNDKNDSKTKELLKPVNREDFQEYERAMSEVAIPKIIKAVEARQMSAAKSRLMHLKG